MLVIVVVYIDYVFLAEALDKDELAKLAADDALERRVQKNVGDRVSAMAGAEKRRKTVQRLGGLGGITDNALFTLCGESRNSPEAQRRINKQKH